MKNDDSEILKSLIVGGFIGAALGALISEKKAAYSLGAIAGAALLASFRANQNARKTNIPVIIEENDALYEIMPDGSKKFIKSIHRIEKNLPERFILE